ncbi:MAG: hypothetical protein FJW22_11395 [Acidimicrobiia bacterium]|nr:hypothetical protein [Acidimicrobiia bacterium]
MATIRRISGLWFTERRFADPADASSTGKFEIIRLDKGDVTMALSTLEADTGIKVERSEEK